MMKDRRIYYLNYDLDATTYKYGRVKDRIQGYGGVKTTGAATTVDAVTVGQAPFAPVRVGDYVIFYIGETPTSIRKVLTKPTQDQITISGANINLGTGVASWYFLPFDIGATDADGGHRTEFFARAWVEIEAVTIAAAGGVDYSIEARGMAPAAKWAQLTTGNIAASGFFKTIEVLELTGEIRVGLKGGSGFAGTDDISVYLTGRPLR
jgi:hypothetical protein